MRRTLPLIALCGILAGCAGSPSPVVPPSPLTEFKPELQVRQTWARRLDDGAAGHFLRLGPVFADGYVYVASRRGLVQAYLAESGERVWRADVALDLGGGPSVGGDLVLLGGDAQILALDRSDGKVRWAAPVSSEALGAPVRAGDTVIARTVDGALYAFAAADGKRLWRVQQTVPLLSLRGAGDPVVANNVVIAGFANGRVAAYALNDGALLWETAVTVPRGRTELERLADVDGRLAMGDGVIYAAGYQGRVAALGLPNGRMLWSREISSYQGLALAGRELFVSDADGNVWALAQNGGGTLWRQDVLRGRELSAPVVQGDTIVVGDLEGHLHWFAREDGRLLARARIEDPEEAFPVSQEYDQPLRNYVEDRHVLSQPVVGDDRIFAYDKRGALGAFRVKPQSNKK